MEVDDYTGMTLWNVSCMRVKSFILRSISLKVFLMIRFNVVDQCLGHLVSPNR
jgi:hypothetical protein